MLSTNEKLQLIKKNTVQVTPEVDLIKKLESGRVLKVKLGADPTAPDLHLGHTVVLEKMKDLQNLGCEVIFLIGNFTAQIGDPTGKSKTRPPLSAEQIAQNATTYFDQVFKILNRERSRVVFNADWLQELSFIDVIKICAKTTLMRLVEREDFKTRMQENTPIGFHELLYPILQGYDSVALAADIELGGTDQTFNLMFGRDLQTHFQQEPQIVITMPILEGLDGVNKMSKSLGNYVGLNDSPEDAFGKLMSLPDNNVFNYLKLILGHSEEACVKLKQDIATGEQHPMVVKKKMAFDIVKKYWGENAALQGQQYFEKVFQNQQFEHAKKVFVGDLASTEVWIVDLIKKAFGISSSSEVKRLIESGAVYLGEQRINSFKEVVLIVEGISLKVGKKVCVLTIKSQI